ncbi:MAG: class I SAM-dependent methyltransferase [Xenococcaceae cyanobacterium]
MFSMVSTIVQKIVRRVNQWLPTDMRSQVAVQLTYGQQFFQDDSSYRYLTDEQIEAFVKEMITLLKPHTAIDLGCGMGMYLRALKSHGVQLIGFDASLHAVQNVDPEVPVFVVDLTKPFRSNQQWDIAICFEVAEHLPKSCASILVDTLCSLSKTILFTAAGPDQPGIDHINLQPKSFWIDLYQRNGFILDEKLTQQFLDHLVSIDVPDWFCRNFSIFVKLNNIEP